MSAGTGGATSAERAGGFVVRPLRTGDLTEVSRVEDDLFGPSAWSRSLLAEEFVAPGRFYVAAVDIADDPATLVGYAGLWFDGEDVQVMTIAVERARQGQGAGRLLLEALVAEARMLPARRALLEVRVDNDAAIGLYESLGFVRLGLRPRYYQPEDVDAWTMELLLG